MTGIQLTVEKTYPTDIGRGLARLAPTILDELRLSPGDFVTINGNQTTIAKILRVDYDDWDVL